MTKLVEIFRNYQLLGDHNDISQIDSTEDQNSTFDIAFEKLIEICYNGRSNTRSRPNAIQLNFFILYIENN